MRVSQTQSKLPLQPSDAVKESSVADFCRIMKLHFFVMNDPVPGKPYAVRFTGPPYDATNEECRSIQVPAHAKGTMLCPLAIFAVLDKFEITVDRYVEALSSKLIPMKPPQDKEQK